MALSLYHFPSCPFCVRVRVAIERLEVEVELRDVHAEPAHLRELADATGCTTVPCLRIEDARGVRWMHESADIVRYLETRPAG
jgi:glutathione S-transferase